MGVRVAGSCFKHFGGHICGPSLQAAGSRLRLSTAIGIAPFVRELVLLGRRDAAGRRVQSLPAGALLSPSCILGILACGCVWPGPLSPPHAPPHTSSCGVRRAARQPVAPLVLQALLLLLHCGAAHLPIPRACFLVCPALARGPPLLSSFCPIYARAPPSPPLTKAYP